MIGRKEVKSETPPSGKHCRLASPVCVCIGTMCVPGALGSQKSTSDLLGLEFKVVVSDHVGAGTRTLVLCKSIKRS